MQILSVSLFALLSASALAMPADLEKRLWGYGNCETRQGELSDLYQRCIGNYRYTPLPPALYWGPKSPEACAKWVRDYTGCSTGNPEGEKPETKKPTDTKKPAGNKSTKDASSSMLEKRQPQHARCVKERQRIRALYQQCLAEIRTKPKDKTKPKTPSGCAMWVRSRTGCDVFAL